jgi:hypothetical protein
MTRRAAFWTVQLAGWSVLGINNYFATAPELLEIEKLPVFLIKMAFAALGFCFSSLLHGLYAHLTPRFRYSVRLVVFVALACFSFGLIWHLVYRLALPPPFGGADMILQFAFVVEAVNNIFVLLAWSAAYFGLIFLRDSRIQEQAAVEAKSLAQETQLKALQYQLNPHFLFNALNSIRALTRDDRVKADEMVTQLAEFLRFTLADAPARETQLHGEVDALEKYLAIEQTRFEDKLQVEIYIEPNAGDCVIPRLLLHPLLENAIKHGMRTSSMPLRVVLQAAMSDGRLHIEVANTGKLVEGNGQQAVGYRDTGIGLANVRERLEHAYPGNHHFEMIQDGDWVRALVNINQTPRELDAEGT